jgi:hypothetical protein
MFVVSNTAANRVFRAQIVHKLKKNVGHM